jgi:hypothetical protein
MVKTCVKTCEKKVGGFCGKLITFGSLVNKPLFFTGFSLVFSHIKSQVFEKLSSVISGFSTKSTDLINKLTRFLFIYQYKDLFYAKPLLFSSVSTPKIMEEEAE